MPNEFERAQPKRMHFCSCLFACGNSCTISFMISVYIVHSRHHISLNPGWLARQLRAELVLAYVCDVFFKFLCK